MAAEAQVGHIAAMLGGYPFSDGRGRRQLVIDLLRGILDDADRVERLDRQRHGELGGTPRHGRQAACKGDQRGDVGVREAVVVLARHDEERPPVGPDTVPDGSHPVGLGVLRDHAGRCDVRRAHPEAAGRIIDEDLSCPVGAMTTTAAARREQILSARQRRVITHHGHALDVNLGHALALAIEQQVGRDHQRDPEHYQHGNESGNPFEQSFHIRSSLRSL